MVRTGAPIEHIVTAQAEEPIVPRFAIEIVIAGRGRPQLNRLAREHIIPVSAEDHIIVRPAIKTIVTQAA